MGDYATKAAFEAATITEKDFDIPGLGMVRLRSLTRAEVFALNDAYGDDPQLMDLYFVLTALVEPELPIEEESLALFPDMPVGIVVKLIRHAMDISGMTPRSRKSSGAPNDAQ